MLNSASPQNLPLVSVIIPAYNQARYVRESILSLLAQTYPHFEGIIVNDGSTDDTPRILEEFHDPRIRVISQPNAGLSAARNTALRASSGAYVTLLDADDFFLPEKLEILVAYLEGHPEAGMAVGGTQLVDQESKIIRQIVHSPANLQFPALLLANPFVPSSVLIRKSWFDRVGDFDETLRACEDWDLWLRMASAGCQFAWVERLVAAYRFHLGQMTRDSDRMRKAILTVLEKFFQQPGLPASLAGYKVAALAAGQVHAAAYAYNAGEFQKGKQDLLEAIRIDPSMQANHYEKLVEMITGWSNDPRSIRPEIFLRKFIDNPPAGHPGLVGRLRRALADTLLGSLFGLERSKIRDHRKDLIKIIQYNPAWLFNRGVLRLILDAWILS